MTTNYPNHPNSFHISGDFSFGIHFGDIASITPVNLGYGHKPHIDIRFNGGARLQLTPTALQEIVSRGSETLKGINE